MKDKESLFNLDMSFSKTTKYNTSDGVLTIEKLDAACKRALEADNKICGIDYPHLTTPNMWDSGYAYCLNCAGILRWKE